MEDFIPQTIAKLKQASSIYDVMTILFRAVSTVNEQKNLREHREWRKTRLHIAELAPIIQIMSLHPEKDFYPGLRELIRFYEDHKTDMVPLAIESLCLFDNEMSELRPPRQHAELVNHGPMNSELCRDLTGAYLYFLPQEAVQGRFLKAFGLRKGGKLLAAHPSGLQKSLRNYTVIPQDRLGIFKPQIWAYYPNEVVQDALRSGPLRIAVCSFGNSPWFSTLYTPNDSIEVRYTPEQDSEILRAYREALALAESHQADIVVFPELALGATARDMILEYLRSTALTRRHIKLIFAGTEWLNSKNTAYIFSADGVLLLTQQKRESFDQYDKKSGITRRENLSDHENQLLFLDVAGLGRVSYSVCRDFLDPGESMIRADLLCSSLVIVSCFTGELGPFLNTAESLSKQYGTAVLVTNSCAAIRQKVPLRNVPEVGFLSIPTCGPQKRVGCSIVSYTVLGDGLCRSDNCGLCSCMELYTIHYPQDAPKELDVLYKKV